MATRAGRPLAFLGRVSFRTALVILLLRAIPGVVLFLLNLTGGAGPVNDWLVENFNLTYHFALPGWLGLVLLLVPVAIILLYFLKLKRKPLQLPTTFPCPKRTQPFPPTILFPSPP